MAAGARRGEGLIEAGGKEYQLFFNNKALAEAERAIGKSMGVLASQVSAGTFSVSETAALLRIGVNSARREFRLKIVPITLDDAFSIMDEVGFLVAGSAVIAPLTEVLVYDPSDADENDEGEEGNPPE